MKLHLGCSDDLRAGWVNVDQALPPALVRHNDGDEWARGHIILPFGSKAEFQQADLNHIWPFAENSVDIIVANEVFEHVHHFQPGNLGKIHCMNEAWRVLKPGGTLSFTVPSFFLVDGRGNPGAIADPTHCTMWSWDDQFFYSEQFNHAAVPHTYEGKPEAGERYRLGAAYGIKAVFRFPPIEQQANGTWRPCLANSDVAWHRTSQAGGERAKLVGRLEAVK